LVDHSGEPIEYVTTLTRLTHGGYVDYDRSPRNVRLLREQIAIDPENPRWRPFLVRDGRAQLSVGEIVKLNREQAALPWSEKTIGGVADEDYLRMIAWHSAASLIASGSSPLVETALSYYPLASTTASTEVMYLRLIAAAIARDVSKLEELTIAASVLRQDLAHEELPWLDAGISICLELSGRKVDATRYRDASDLYTDVFCYDSVLRKEFRPVGFAE
jgi:hypothetical protein